MGRKERKWLGRSVVLAVLLMISIHAQAQQWKQINYPWSAQRIVVWGAYLVVLDDAYAGQMHYSREGGESWSLIFNFSAIYPNTIFSDGTSLYVATDEDIYAKQTLLGGLEKIFSGNPDNITSMDFHNGYGWATVAQWGRQSGISRMSADGTWVKANGNLPYGYVGVLGLVRADMLDPANVAYVWGVRGDTGPKYFSTTDAGQTWVEIANPVWETFHYNGLSVLLSDRYLSVDQGKNWEDLGFKAVAYDWQPATNVLLVMTDDDLIYRINFNPEQITIQCVGDLPGTVVSMVSHANMIWVITEEGLIYRYTTNH